MATPRFGEGEEGIVENTIVDAVLEQVEVRGCSEQVGPGLREDFPELHFTFCMDDDVTHGKPVREGTRANLYLVRRGDHCLSLTDDLGAATGFVIAERDDSE